MVALIDPEVRVWQHGRFVRRSRLDVSTNLRQKSIAQIIMFLWKKYFTDRWKFIHQKQCMYTNHTDLFLKTETPSARARGGGLSFNINGVESSHFEQIFVPYIAIINTSKNSIRRVFQCFSIITLKISLKKIQGVQRPDGTMEDHTVDHYIFYYLEDNLRSPSLHTEKFTNLLR